MKTYLNIPKLYLCDKCLNRDKCTTFSHRVKHCWSPHGFSYRPDEKRIREYREHAESLMDEFRATFARVRPEQISLEIGSGEIMFCKLPKEERMKNSREERRERLEDGISYRKWCEQCGNDFETVNVNRHICDACWEEICGRIGYDYSGLVKLLK